jgi:hypothetical protein
MAYKNKKDQARAALKHYEKNKDKIKDRSRRRNINQRNKNKDFVARVKRMSRCLDCGEGNPVVLDFDHVRGEKRANISDMVRWSYSLETIKKEIRKCEVRCSNCHRKKTHERRMHQ